MPVYEYECDEHGVFTAMRPMSEYADPYPCPDCTIDARRVIVSVPHFSNLSATTRAAHALNERSQHAPKESSGRPHAAGCSCCSKTSRKKAKGSPAAAKAFPNKRPWMISH